MKKDKPETKMKKPRPIKWKEPVLNRMWTTPYEYYVVCWAVGGGPALSGPIRRTKAAAIRSWNKQHGADR